MRRNYAVNNDTTSNVVSARINVGIVHRLERLSSDVKLREYVGPVPTYCAAVRLAIALQP